MSSIYWHARPALCVGRYVVACLVVCVLSLWSSVSYASTLRFNITRIEQFDWEVNTGLFEGKNGDFYVNLNIGGTPLTNLGLGLSDGECFLGCPNIGPTRGDPIVFDLGAVQENWSFRKELTSNDPFDIAIDLRDAVAFNGTTQMNIGPGASPTATLHVDPTTGTWSGDA